MGCSWCVLAALMGCMWDTHGMLMGYPWGAYGVMDCPWGARGRSVRYVCGLHEPSVRCPRGAHRVFVGVRKLSVGTHGLSVECPWAASRM